MAYAVVQFTVQDAEGNIKPGASVKVSSEATGSLAAIYSDRDGNTPRANPFTVGDDAFAQFFAPGGAYKIEVTDDDDLSITHRYVAVGTASERDADIYGQLSPTLRWRELQDISNTDLDELVTAGFYVGDNLTNSPDTTAATFYVQVLINENSAHGVQIAWSSDGDPITYIRTLVSGTWSDWKTTLFDGDIAPAEEPDVELLLDGVVGSTSGAVDIVFPTGYKKFVIDLHFRPTTDQVYLGIRTSTDGGSTFASGASDYAWADAIIHFDGASIIEPGTDDADSDAAIAYFVGNTSSEGVYGHIEFYEPFNTGRTKCWYHWALDPQIVHSFGMGMRNSTADIDAIRLFFSSGSIAAGSTYKMWGYK